MEIEEIKEIMTSIPISKGGLTEGQWDEFFLPQLEWLETHLEEAGIK